jgi:hypothetical protein
MMLPNRKTEHRLKSRAGLVCNPTPLNQVVSEMSAVS